MYAYVGNDPINWNDPLGLDKGNPVLDKVQGVLDLLGLIPVVGEIFDLANAGISWLRGNKADALLSLAATAPVIGMGATATKYIKKSGLPELIFDYSKHADLSDNIWHAQKAGHPNVLTHGGDRIANKSAALNGVPNLRPLSRDEYPFASSLEGGANSWVGHVPVSQQNSQGAMIKNFISGNNLQPGSQYRVRVINHPGGP